MPIDFKKHNEEVREVWAAYWAGKPIRVPLKISCNPRMLLLDPALNPKKITFKQYFESPEIMLNIQVQFEKWKRLNLEDDSEMGLPEERWLPFVDLQNISEAAWFGAPINFKEEQCPDTEPIMAGDKKNLLFDRGIPDPLSGIVKMAQDYIEYFNEKAKAGIKYEGFPVNGGGKLACGTDGVMTVAMNLRGSELLTDFYEDPDYVRMLFDFITEATIKRFHGIRKFHGDPQKTDDFWYADDSVAMLSGEMVREFVLPCHKKLHSAVSTGKNPVSMHLCGDATRHFKLFRDEMFVRSFDTGFPVDFAWLRKELGPGVEIQGGPRVALVLSGTEDELLFEARRILESGIMEGGRFIFKEGNNLAPLTPMGNIRVMLEACRRFGKYK